MRSIAIFLLFVLFGLSESLSMRPDDFSQKDLCANCQKFSEKFIESFKKTAHSNFGGGNTDWEERKLKQYKQSETRFIEILEDSCQKSDGLCNSFIEKYEDTIEEWYQTKPETAIGDFQNWLCIETAKVCCPNGRFGKNCRRCQLGDNGLVCSANGKCDGDGKREGTGRCVCDQNFTGTNCSICRAGFTTSIDDQSRTICTDIDECQMSIFLSPCGLLKCQNTNGAYECVGEPFYRDFHMNSMAVIFLSLFSVLVVLYTKHIV